MVKGSRGRIDTFYNVDSFINFMQTITLKIQATQLRLG
jgi:hypothetical protein